MYDMPDPDWKVALVFFVIVLGVPFAPAVTAWILTSSLLLSCFVYVVAVEVLVKLNDRYHWWKRTYRYVYKNIQENLSSKL